MTFSSFLTNKRHVLKYGGSTTFVFDVKLTLCFDVSVLAS
jgi:hypothetical protein